MTDSSDFTTLTLEERYEFTPEGQEFARERDLSLQPRGPIIERPKVPSLGVKRITFDLTLPSRRDIYEHIFARCLAGLWTTDCHRPHPALASSALPDKDEFIR